MADNLQRLLTQFGQAQDRAANQQPIGVGRDFGERLASSVGSIGSSLFGGLTKTAQALGAPIDTTSPATRLRARLAELNPLENKEDRIEFIKIVQTISGPEAAVQAAQQFAQSDRQKVEAQYAANREARAVAAETRAEEAALRASREEQRKIDQILYNRTKDATQEDREARRLEIAEEKLAIAQAKHKGEVDKEKQDKLRAGNLRALYLDQARSQDRLELVDAIEAGMELSVIEKALYGSSNALSRAPSDNEAAAMEAIINSEGFKESIKGLPRKTIAIFFDDGLDADVKRAVFYKAKELQRIDTKITVEEALREALKVVTKLYEVKDDDDDPDANVL